MQLVPREVGSATLKIPIALRVVLSEEDLFANTFSVSTAFSVFLKKPLKVMASEFQHISFHYSEINFTVLNYGSFTKSTHITYSVEE